MKLTFRHFCAAVLAMTALAGPAFAEGNIFIASDSTAANYKPDWYPQMGWGMLLKCNLADGVTVENRAIGGRSTKTFISEGRFDAIARDITPGDTLLIQFGHNDQKAQWPQTYADPAISYPAESCAALPLHHAFGAAPLPVPERI